MMSSQTKARLISAAKFLLSISLIAVLLGRVDAGLLLERFRSIDVSFLVLVFFLPHVAMLFSTIKWQILLDSLGLRVRLSRLFGLYMVGTFFSNFLPTTVGGDVVKSYALSRDTGDGASVLAATFLDRFVGLAALVSLLPLVLFNEALKKAILMLNTVIIATIFAYFLLVLIVASPIFDYIRGLSLNAGVVSRLWGFVEKTHNAILKFRYFKGSLFWSFILSLAFYAATFATTWAATRCVGADVPFLYLATIVPIVLLASSIPVSLNGIGVAEAGYVFFLQLLNVTPENALAVALLLRIRILCTGLLGGLVFLRYRVPVSQAA